MKKLLTIVFAMLLAGSLSFAQGTTGASDAQKPTTTAAGKKATKTKAHKGSKKSKKGSSTTPAATAPSK